MAQLIESFEEWVDHNGGGLVQVGPGLWLTANGATVKNDGTGPMTFPPAPGLAGLRNRERYHKTRLTRVEADFRRLKAAVEGGEPFRWPEDGRYGPAILDRYGSPDAIGALRHLQSLVLIERDKLKTVEQLIANAPEMVAQRQQEERLKAMDRERAAQAMARAQEAAAITI